MRSRKDLANTTSSLGIEEVCPSCGEFTLGLNALTGFCLECSPYSCSRCGGFTGNNGHKLCIRCQREEWWERNADQIELYLSRGMSLSEARGRIRRENRAVCISCAQPIPGRSRQTTIFCTRTQACKTAKRRYLWNIQKGIPRDLALEQALQERMIDETIEQLREGISIGQQQTSGRGSASP
jgi:hypothetical protein